MTNCHESRTGAVFGGVVVWEARQMAVFNAYAGEARRLG